MYVDEAAELFLTPLIGQLYGDHYADLAAYDLDTGDRVWRKELPTGGVPLFECGEMRVCSRGDYEQIRYGVTDGEHAPLSETIVDANTATIIAADGDRIVTVARDHEDFETFLGLTGFDDYGGKERWQISSNELSELLGVPVDPGWGWNSDVDRSAGIAALTLAHADFELVGGAIGVDLATGRTIWSRSGVTDCVYNYPEDRPMIKCLAAADDRSVVNRIVRMDPATGDDLWSIDIADPFVPYDVEIVHGTDYLYVWIGGQVLVYDLDDGRPVVSNGPFLCVNSVWAYDVDYFEDEPWEYYADTVVVLCDADGFLLEPLDIADAIDDTDIAASRRVSFDWELRPFVIDAVPQAMIDGDSGEA